MFLKNNEQPIDLPRSYLKGSKYERGLKLMKSKVESFRRRVAPTDSDFSESKNSFKDQLMKTNFSVHSGAILI